MIFYDFNTDKIAILALAQYIGICLIQINSNNMSYYNHFVQGHFIQVFI